jgi:hypothetical protein
MAENRRCNRCGELKPLESYAWHRKAAGQRQHHCRRCQSVIGREHYTANRERYIELEAQRKRARNQKRMRQLIDFLRANPCVDCGESDPLVLEFDHLGNKRFNISQGFSGRNWQSVLEEMAKCEVVCANCHRRRTAHRRGHVRAILIAESSPE